MAEGAKARIGFVSGGNSSMPHYNSFLPMVPREVEIDFQGLGLYGKSLYEISDKKDIILGRVKEFIAERKWDGLILTAAPTEVLNPGLFDISRRRCRFRLPPRSCLCCGAASLLGAEGLAAHALRRAAQ